MLWWTSHRKPFYFRQKQAVHQKRLWYSQQLTVFVCNHLCRYQHAPRGFITNWTFLFIAGSIDGAGSYRAVYHCRKISTRIAGYGNNSQRGRLARYNHPLNDARFCCKKHIYIRYSNLDPQHGSPWNAMICKLWPGDMLSRYKLSARLLCLVCESLAIQTCLSSGLQDGVTGVTSILFGGWLPYVILFISSDGGQNLQHYDREKSIRRAMEPKH